MQKPKVNRERIIISKIACDVCYGDTIETIMKHAHKLDPAAKQDELVFRWSDNNGYDDHDMIVTLERIESDEQYYLRIEEEEAALKEWEKQEVIKEARRKEQKKKDTEREVKLLETRLTELKLHGLK